MDSSAIERIGQHPDFTRLVRRKQRLVWSLTSIMLVSYYGFVLLMAFAPEVSGLSVGGSVINLGMLAASALIVLSFILTAWYVYVNNRIFDPMLDAIVRGCGQ